MMSCIKELTDYLESLFPVELQEHYDNSGLLTGNQNDQVQSVMICLNITSDVIREAKENQCNLIVSHHPLIFSGLKKITGASSTERLVEEVIRSNIAVYALHTNADNSFPGLNSFIAGKLGLKDIKVLSPQKGVLRKLITFCPDEHAEKVRSALFEAGAGEIGNYDSCSFNSQGYGTFRGSEDSNPFVGMPGKLHLENEVKIETVFPVHLYKRVVHALFQAHPYEEVAYDIYLLENENPFAGTGCVGYFENSMKTDDFLEKIKFVFGTEFLKYSGSTDLEIQKVAVCGGSGASMIQRSIQVKADAFITADLKYHDFDHGRNNYLLVDAGHFETELFFKEYIVNLLTKKFTNFAIYFAESEKNYVCYY